MDNNRMNEKEQKLLQFLNSNMDLNEFLIEQNDYFFYYHLSPIRQNAINWIRISKEDTVLEVNPELGAITSWLVKNCGKLVAFFSDSTVPNAFIKRFENEDKVEIICGDIELIKIRFDFIIFQGCHKNSHLNLDILLPLIRKYIKKSGKMVLCIENSLGIRYLSGAKCEMEIELSDLYTKAEVEKILRKNKLAYDFYYPVPDYSFPIEIYSEFKQPKLGDIYGDSPRYQESHDRFLDEDAFRNRLIENNVYDVFVNSFIIEVSYED